MLDYTYWQSKVRGRLHNNNIFWYEIKRENYNLMLGLDCEINLENLLNEYGFTIVNNKISYIFAKQPQVIVSKGENRISEDNLMLIGLTCGLKDIYFDDADLAYFFCSEDKLNEVDAILFLEDIESKAKIIAYKPLEILEVYKKENAQFLLQFLAKICDNKNIVDICFNFCFDESYLKVE